MNWRNIIKETISYKGISAADIERQTNISKGLLSNYFAGRTNMSTSNIEQILDILNINLPFHKKNIPEERYEENDFNHFLIDIQEREVLNDTQKGVIRQTLAKGYNSLTDKQKKVIYGIVEPYYVEECKFCMDRIEWYDMLNAYEQDEYCTYCYEKWQKLKNEIRKTKF